MQAHGLKRVLNLHEAATEARLREVCERNSARVFAKVRLADVFPIEGSGITEKDYRFTLMAHLDFLVADSDHAPLFAVEFDGPSHHSAKQRMRDEAKDKLCQVFGLPLLRINSNYLHVKYRNMDLLSWFMEVWFAARWFDEAQRDGSVPYDEPFMPMSFISISGRTGQFPLHLSAGVRGKIQRHFFAGRVKDMVPSAYIGRNASGTYRALGFMRIAEGSGVMTETGMRAQQFPVSLAEALDEVVICNLYERLESVLAGREAAISIDQIFARLSQLRASYECRFAVNEGCERPPVMSR